MTSRTASNVRKGDVVTIKTSKTQVIGKDAPQWLVTKHDVLEVDNKVTSVKWELSPIGEHNYFGARTGKHEYAPHPNGLYTVAPS